MACQLLRISTDKRRYVMAQAEAKSHDTGRLFARNRGGFGEEHPGHSQGRSRLTWGDVPQGAAILWSLRSRPTLRRNRSISLANIGTHTSTGVRSSMTRAGSL